MGGGGGGRVRAFRLFSCHSNIDKVYTGLGENIALLIQWISTFLTAIVVGFVRDWRLALLMLAIVPFLALAAGVFSVVSAQGLAVRSHGPSSPSSGGRLLTWPGLPVLSPSSASGGLRVCQA